MFIVCNRFTSDAQLWILNSDLHAPFRIVCHIYYIIFYIISVKINICFGILNFSLPFFLVDIIHLDFPIIS